jgi:threonine/homoserine/homoserine lactone efflux protein
MIETSKFALFAAIAWALIITPGPDMMYVITHGMTYSRKAGIVSAFGVIGGIFVHTTSAAFGITLIFQTSVLAFLIMKNLGAIYLIYLGIKAWRDKSAFNLQSQTTIMNPRSLFWHGVLSNILNPKIAVFFLAFLPQFVNQGSSQVALQMTILGMTFAGFGLCFLVIVGFFAGSVGKWLTRSPQSTKILHRLTGSILISLGVRLSLTEQR